MGLLLLGAYLRLYMVAVGPIVYGVVEICIRNEVFFILCNFSVLFPDYTIIGIYYYIERSASKASKSNRLWGGRNLHTTPSGWLHIPSQYILCA